MTSDMERLQQAAAALNRGAASEALSLIGGLTGAEVDALRGMAHLALGDVVNALAMFQRLPEPVLARRQIALAKAKAHRRLGQWEDSRDALTALLRREPGNGQAAYYLAMAQLESGDALGARDGFLRLIQSKQHVAEAQYMLGRAHLELGEAEASLRAFFSAHQLAPTQMTLRALANGFWMSGEIDKFAQVLETAPDALSVIAYQLWVESGDFERADLAWRSLSPALRNGLGALAVRTQHLRQTGDGPGTLFAAEAAAALAPDNPAVVDGLAAGYLMCGNGEAALKAIAPFRQAQPDNQHWIAHESTALRLMADPRADALLDYERLVQVYDLPVPEGFADIHAFNAAFVAALNEHHIYDRHPLDQSLRHGSQTSQDLMRMTDPVVKAYIAALSAPIAAYVDSLGTSPDHPISARNTGRFKIAGCWSVRLGPGGHHVNHVHPEGWISSAYYAAVPVETESGDRRAGWIKFGEPPFETRPACAPGMWVQPKPGRLVLFPSYLWHGTAPITENGVRITAPFDVVPA